MELLSLITALTKAWAPEGSFLGHRYIHAHGWSTDRTKLLVSISGHEGDLQIPAWFAIYDLGTGGPSFDLSALNE